MPCGPLCLSESTMPDLSPHVLLLPYPAQGHVKPMFMLAELLCHSGLRVTFLNIDHNHHQLLQSATASGHCNSHQLLHFISLSEESPVKDHRTSLQHAELLLTMDSTYKSKFMNLVLSLDKDKEGGWPRPTCIIADGLMSFPVDVAEELDIPVVAFRTYSASCTWTCFHISKLIQLGEVPFSDDKIDQSVTCIPGLESVLRRRDLPGICKFQDPDHPILRFYINQAATLARAPALLLNTFHELEAPIIDQLGSIYSRIYTVGPLHELIDVRVKDRLLQSPLASLREQNRTCLTWLDSHKAKSVLYVSFGSLVTMTNDQLLEFWYGIVNSGSPFLWVIRSELTGKDDKESNIPQEIMVATKDRGCIVDWAPQEEILGHQSVGGFLTHSGWNSTIESISANVPMICWPQFADQPVNSRCVSDLWRVGLDMKDTCDRLTIERMVRDLMEDKRGDIMKSLSKFSTIAQESVRKGGSSEKSLQTLIEDIRLNSFSSRNEDKM